MLRNCGQKQAASSVWGVGWDPEREKKETGGIFPFPVCQGTAASAQPLALQLWEKNKLPASSNITEQPSSIQAPTSAASRA